MVAPYKYLIKILTFCIFVLNSLFILVIASSTVKGNDNAVPGASIDGTLVLGGPLRSGKVMDFLGFMRGLELMERQVSPSPIPSIVGELQQPT